MRLEVPNLANLITFFLLALLGLFSSCTHYYYAPNDGTNLALVEKNDLQLAGGIGISPFLNPGTSASVQAGYSPINHLGIQTSYFSTNFKGNIEDSLANGKISQWSTAIGGYYFLPLEEKDENFNSVLNAQRGILFDLYIGYDLGKAFNQYTRSGKSNLKFNKKFIQFGTHYVGKVINLDVTLKTGVLDYTSAVLRGNVSGKRLSEVEAVIANDTYTFSELGIRFSVGLRFGSAYGGLTKFISSYPANVNFKDRIFQVGYVVQLDEIFRKNKPERKDFLD